MLKPIQNLTEYHSAYQQSVDTPEAFWSDIANQFQWIKPWDQVLEWDFDKFNVSWFKGAQLNITENCLDRHLETRGDQIAILWEANTPDKHSRHLTYRQLHAEVCKAANMLKNAGVKKGDRICIYMPMVPEALPDLINLSVSRWMRVVIFMWQT